MPLKQPFGTLIALNVTRTRVTVLVFNLSIVSVMLSILSAADKDGMTHLTSLTALFVSFCLTLLGLFWLMHSQIWDEQGLSHPRSFAFGSITTYLALSQTITAFMHEYLLGFKSLLPGTTESAVTGVPDNPVFLILLVLGGGIWIMITYIAPVVITIKVSRMGGGLWIFFGYYFLLQIPVYWVYARVWHLQYASADQPLNLLSLFAQQFFQPLLWFS